MGILGHSLVGLIFLGYIALAITIDQRLRTARARARGEVNFDEGRPSAYVSWALLSGGLILPIYFYASRKRAWALVLGSAVLAVVYVATLLTAGAAATAIRALAH
jgi:hypothetical protein